MKRIFLLVSVISIASAFLFVAYQPPSYSSTDSKRKKRSDESATEVIQTNIHGQGNPISIEFTKGKSYKNPVLAIWIEDMNGNYIQTLYVVQSVATSVYRHGRATWGHWNPAIVRRAATLPHWAHKRGIKSPDGLYMPSAENPIADAYTGATPKKNFVLSSKSDSPLREDFKVLLEINLPFDWNNYWHNNKYPADADYKTSGQPPIVYEAVIRLESSNQKFELKPVGFSHYSGKDGSLNPDLSSITTALQAVGKVMVSLE